MKQWKKIEGFENYSVSSDAEIRNDTSGKILKPFKTNCGYYVVRMSVKGKQKRIYLHRAVAKAFVENPKNNPQVNHIDGIKTNNNIHNLEWVTAKENRIHCCYVLGKMPPKENYKKAYERSAKLFSKPVICVETGVIYDSAMDAYRKTGIFHANIGRCANGKAPSAGGFHWERLEVNNYEQR